jgi:class 3 adenylate cyclase
MNQPPEENLPSNPELNSPKWSDPLGGVLLENPHFGVFAVNREDRVTFWNRGAELLTGYSPQEAAEAPSIGNLLNLLDFKGTSIVGIDGPLVRCLVSGKGSSLRARMGTKDRAVLTVMMHVLPVTAPSGTPSVAVFFHDVSREEDMIQAQRTVNDSLKKYVSDATYKEALYKAVSSRDIRPEAIERTVLFMDMVGFTTFAEKHDPETVTRTLNDLLGLCGEAVRECGGDVDKFIGDALMAVFEEPKAGLRAALEIRAELLEYNALRKKRGEGPIEVRTGLNSGVLIRGEIGTRQRKELTVMGDVVNTAARVQSKAGPGQILVTKATYDLVANKEDFASVGKVALKGKKKPVPIYRLKA